MATKAPEPTFLPAKVSPETVEALDRIASNRTLTIGSQFSRAFATATAISQLNALLTKDVMIPIMSLQNSSLGFMTDNRAGGYSVDTVRECLIDAILNGVQPVGNEFNIIKGRTYITKNGMRRKLRDIPGLSYTITPGFPTSSKDGSGAGVIMSIDWTYNGEKNHKELPVAVRVNKDMGTDGILGKATRKASSWLFETVTGQIVEEGEAGEDGKYINTTAKEVSPLEAPQMSPAANETTEPQTEVLGSGTLL